MNQWEQQRKSWEKMYQMFQNYENNFKKALRFEKQFFIIDKAFCD